MICVGCEHDETEHAFKIYAHPNAGVHDKRCMATSCPCRCFKRGMTVDKLAKVLAMYQSEGMGDFEICLGIITSGKRIWGRATTQTAQAHGLGGGLLIMGEEYEA